MKTKVSSPTGSPFNTRQQTIFPSFSYTSVSISAEDEEDTIAAQEVAEGAGDHAEELDDLAKEGRFFPPLHLHLFFLKPFICIKQSEPDHALILVGVYEVFYRVY